MDIQTATIIKSII